MDQNEMFHENLSSAARSLVAALGGLQKVGHTLRPNKSPLDAGKWLSDALNEGHPTELHPDDLMALLRLGRDRGIHLLAAWLMREAGYGDPTPVNPEDEKAALQREYIEYAKHMRRVAERLERVELQVVKTA